MRVRAVDYAGNAGTYSSTVSRSVPRTATDDNDDNSITTTKRQLLTTQTATSGSIGSNTHTHVENTAAAYVQNATTAVNTGVPNFNIVTFTHSLGRLTSAITRSSGTNDITCAVASSSTQLGVLALNLLSSANTFTVAIDYW